jgi:hypothetical protein
MRLSEPPLRASSGMETAQRWVLTIEWLVAGGRQGAF